MKKFKVMVLLVLAMVLCVSATASAHDYSGTLQPGAVATQTTRYKKVYAGNFQVAPTQHSNTSVSVDFGIRNVNGERVHVKVQTRNGLGSFSIVYKDKSGIVDHKYELAAQNVGSAAVKTAGTWEP